MISASADKLPGFLNFLLKWFYKEEDIKKKIVVDLISSQSAVQVFNFFSNDGGISIWLRFANFTPFELTVQSITLEFKYGTTKKLTKIDHEKIDRLTEHRINLTERLISEEEKAIGKALKNNKNKPQLSYTIDFSNRLYRFKKEGYWGISQNFPFDVLNKEEVLQKLEKNSE